MSQVHGSIALEIPVEKLAELVALRVVAMLRPDVPIQRDPDERKTEVFDAAEMPPRGGPPATNLDDDATPNRDYLTGGEHA